MYNIIHNNSPVDQPPRRRSVHHVVESRLLTVDQSLLFELWLLIGLERSLRLQSVKHRLRIDIIIGRSFFDFELCIVDKAEDADAIVADRHGSLASTATLAARQLDLDVCRRQRAQPEH